MEFEAGDEGSGVKEGEDETEGDGGGEAERGRLGMGSEGSGVGAKVTLVGSCPFLVSFYCRAFPTVMFLTLVSSIDVLNTEASAVSTSFFALQEQAKCLGLRNGVKAKLLSP